uniref:Uncharacterized protein n=1 Tax=Nelumbo nucifera TaxID=4432 RepID=A0A822YF34_NELNU|nr:TPA_asm: hypothetical protein HUJ06_009991 [Nelumbo nucifera]
MRNEDIRVEPQKPSIVIRPPTEADRDQPCKKIIIKQTKTVANVDQVKQEASSGLGEEHRKTKKMIELSSFEKHREKERKQLAEEASWRKAAKGKIVGRGGKEEIYRQVERGENKEAL